MKKIYPATAQRDNRGRLRVADIDLGDLAHKYGTPLYIYDSSTVVQHANLLKNALARFYPGSSEVTYAAKAYFSLGIAKKLAQLGLGVDVVSRGELKIALMAGFPPDRIHLHGNNKSEEEILLGLRQGIHAIVADSLEELVLINRLADSEGKIAPVWVRITPGVKAGGHAYLQTAHHASKFGVSILDGQAQQALEIVRSSRYLNLLGLHMHLGSQIFDPQNYSEALEVIFTLADQAPSPLQEISPGGGWGVPYIPGDPETNPEDWVATVAGTVVSLCDQRGWRLPKLVLEPGRFLVARAGMALYTVGATKVTGEGIHIVSLDGGIADNPRPALYQARYTATLVERLDSAPLKPTALVGKFCESGDQLIPQIEFPAVNRGDLVAIPVAGAYQLSMASNYNLAERPAVLWLEDGKEELLQPRESAEENSWWLGESKV
ncbi:MAG TPA: diaminopimelate decarboxylase [Anaerolineaceae bacterium]